MPQKKSDGRLRLSLITLLAAPAALALACGDTIQNDYHSTNHYGNGGADADAGGAGGEPAKAGSSSTPEGGEDGEGGEGGASEPGGAGQAGEGGEGGEGGATDGRDSRYPDAPTADTAVEDLELHLFETPGNRFWFAVSDEQVKQMNEGDQGGGCCGGGGIYQPGGGGKANWVDHLFVTTAGDTPQTADFGKVQAKVVGQSSRHPWIPTDIPNINIDADQFVKGQRIDGYEHLRFSNGQVGSIFRDRVAYDLYRMLEYPAPLVTYAWVQSNVWGPDVSIPYILVERYKRKFCERFSEQFGGGCPNMWEFYGDFNGGIWGGMGGSVFDNPDNCQIEECDATRAKALEAKILEAPQGDGFKAALTDYVDWPAFHRFQCLSWVLSTGDDPIHASNNVVLVERDDGKFQFLPYSVDLSMSPGWHVGLMGSGNALARGCQAEASCWEDTLNVCEEVIAKFQEIEPLEYLESIWQELDDNGMLRRGDEGNYAGVRDYLAERLENLPSELEAYRSGTYCEYPYVDCNGSCVLEWECRNPCFPPDKGPVVVAVMGAGGAPGDGDVGAGGDVGVGGGGPICVMNVGYNVAP